MYHGKSIALLIPAKNEALSLPRVLRAVPSQIDRVVVIDNGSTDATAFIAQEHGASVVSVPEAGYGRSCLAGIAFLRSNPPDIVAFADGDGSDDVSRLLELIDHMTTKSADLVMEKRIPVYPEAISPQQCGESNRLLHWKKSRSASATKKQAWGPFPKHLRSLTPSLLQIRRRIRRI